MYTLKFVPSRVASIGPGPFQANIFLDKAFCLFQGQARHITARVLVTKSRILIEAQAHILMLDKRPRRVMVWRMLLPHAMCVEIRIILCINPAVLAQERPCRVQRLR